MSRAAKPKRSKTAARLRTPYSLREDALVKAYALILATGRSLSALGTMLQGVEIPERLVEAGPTKVRGTRRGLADRRRAASRKGHAGPASRGRP